LILRLEVWVSRQNSLSLHRLAYAEIEGGSSTAKVRVCGLCGGYTFRTFRYRVVDNMEKSKHIYILRVDKQKGIRYSYRITFQWFKQFFQKYWWLQLTGLLPGTISK